MEIRFEVDPQKLTVADMLLIEDVQDGLHPFHGMVELLSKNMTNPEGEPLEQAEAVKILGGLNMSDFNAAAKAFGEAIQRKAIPPMKNGI